MNEYELNEYELFLQELNAITNYANSSNTDYTPHFVKKMLDALLHSTISELSGTRCCFYSGSETCKEKEE